ncbi:hypothetical protein PAXINDRAFT_56381, partial [Paxillus involutus ATCC 200175]
HVERELKQLVPDVKKAQNVHSMLASCISALQSVIDKAEHGIFASFCAKIGVGHIREYEERQLKVVEKESQARLRYDQQIARLTHQSQFEEEQLQLTQGCLATTQEEEEVKVVELEEQKRVLQEEITSGQETIAKLRGGLKALNETLDEKTKTVEQ